LLEMPYRLAPPAVRRRQDAGRSRLCEAPGLEVPRMAGVTIIATVCLPSCLLLLLRFSTAALVLAPVCAACGMLLPRLMSLQARNRHLQAVRQSLPDTADMLYAHVLGGKNLDQAFKGAAALAREPLGPLLTVAVREMELGSTREEAFDRLSRACPVRELASLLRSLLEAEKRGHSLSASLAVFSREIRLRRRDQVRAAGARAPLKMLVPLIFLILPASVLLTVGPTLLVTLQRMF
jgi:tight adherence protein C